MTLDKKPRASARATLFIMSPATMMEPEPVSNPPADDVEAIAHQEPIVASGDQLPAPISGSRENDKTDATTAGGTALPSSTPSSPDECAAVEECMIDEVNHFEAFLPGEVVYAETDAFQCGQCRQRKTKYRQVQTRSRDEPMTVCSFPLL